MSETASIHTAIADLEARARDYETKAGQCREVIAQLRGIFGLTPLASTTAAPPPPPAPSPAVAMTPPPRRARTASTPASDDPLQARALKFLSVQRTPVAMRVLVDHVVEKEESCEYLVKRAVDALEAAGQVVRTGKTLGMRIGIPAVMAAAAAAAKEAL